jgi:DNA polymerase III delta subunit
LPAALDDLRSPALFGGPQVLVVRRADALPEADQARVTDALPGLGAGGTLLLVARIADQRRKLVAACTRAGAVYAFPAVTDPHALEAWVTRLAADRGHEVASAAARELVDRSGGDLAALDGEIEKLALHVGGRRRIEAQHVRDLVAALRTHAVEELTDRLARRDLAGAVRVLRGLLAEGEPPIRAVAFLAANLRRALHVAELAERGCTPDQIAQRLGMPSWLVGRHAGRGRARDLAAALIVLERLDLDLKRSRPTEAVFEAALLEIAGASAPPRS